ncbi:MAG TPA: hypothetical protein VIU15_27760 [Streptomyces sp.]
MGISSPLALNETTEIKAVFDPVGRNFQVQLWQDSQVAAQLGEGIRLSHPYEILEEIDAFLVEHDLEPLTEEQTGHLCVMLITAKGGPDLALLKASRTNPQGFLII